MEIWNHGNGEAYVLEGWHRCHIVIFWHPWSWIERQAWRWCCLARFWWWWGWCIAWWCCRRTRGDHCQQSLRRDGSLIRKGGWSQLVVRRWLFSPEARQIWEFKKVSVSVGMQVPTPCANRPISLARLVVHVVLSGAWHKCQYLRTSLVAASRTECASSVVAVPLRARWWMWPER